MDDLDAQYRVCSTCRFVSREAHYEPCVFCCDEDDYTRWMPDVKLYEYLEKHIAEEALND